MRTLGCLLLPGAHLGALLFLELRPLLLLHPRPLRVHLRLIGLLAGGQLLALLLLLAAILGLTGVVACAALCFLLGLLMLLALKIGALLGGGALAFLFLLAGALFALQPGAAGAIILGQGGGGRCQPECRGAAEQATSCKTRHWASPADCPGNGF